MSATPPPSVKLTAEGYPRGTVLAGRYRVERALGEGGMGQVYECEHVSVGRKIAVKVLQPWLAQHPVGERLRTEARAASAAGHRNIVDVLDAGILDDGRPFIAMEFLEGKTLLDLIEEARELPPHTAASLAEQIARGLHAAHDKGIVHRDLKPENVMVLEQDGEQIVKIVDFGIAFDSVDGKRHTREGLAVGTPQYMAPEQVFGAAGTPKFDIYALGVLIFEMCTGMPPFDGLEVSDILEAKAKTLAPRLDTWNPDVPMWLADLVAQCLEHDPAARPADAREVAVRLDQGVRDSSTGVIPVPLDGGGAVVTPVETTAPTGTGSSMLPWLGLGGGVFVAVVLVLWLFQPPPGVATLGFARVPLVVPTAEPQPQPKPVVEPEPEPEPVVEPEPEPEPEPRRRRAELPKVGPAKPTKPAEPRPSINCDGVEERARSASTKHLWAPVLQEVSKKSCWESPAERLKLHVHALKELERFSRCAEVAKGSSDPEVRRWRSLCEKRAE